MVVKSRKQTFFFFTLKASHKSFTTNYAFKDKIRYTGTFITQGRSMYINWMVVKSRKQTFLHIKGIYTKVLPQTMHLKIKLDILEPLTIEKIM